MTPYTERRNSGYYDAPKQDEKKPAPAKSGATKTTTKKDQS